MIKENNQGGFTPEAGDYLQDGLEEAELSRRAEMEMGKKQLGSILRQLETKLINSGNKNEDWSKKQVEKLSQDVNRLAVIKEELRLNAEANKGDDGREEVIARLADELITQPYPAEASAENR